MPRATDGYRGQPNFTIAIWQSEVLTVVTAGLVSAQPLPRSFEASPDVYKVIAENNEYRVIAVTWKPGQRDVQHSHPASTVYYLTNSALRIHAQDGKFRDANQ